MEEIIRMLEYEINKHKYNEEKLEELKLQQDLYKEILNYDKNIEMILDNKESILLILENLDKNIYMALLNKIAYIENLRRKNLIDSKEYLNAFKYIEKIFAEISKKYEEVKLMSLEQEKALIENKECNTIFQTIISKIKYNQFISKSYIKYLSMFFEKKGLSSIQQIKLLELVDIYNKEIYEKINNLPNNYKNDILDMLSFGFEIFEDQTLDYNSEIAKKVELHYSLLEFQTDFEQYLKEIQLEIPDNNDLQLFYILMINKIQDEIIELISIIKDKEFYADEDIKKDIIEQYRKLLNYYLKFRNEYLKKTEKNDQFIFQDKIEIVFAKDSDNSKPYFIKDLKYISNENLNRVLNLIESLINRTLTYKKIEGFSSQWKDFRKLKDGQIRIIIKELKPNLYCIMGVAEKKRQKGDLIYNTLCTRNCPICDAEYEELMQESQEIMDYIQNYINENKRKGNR